MPTHEKSAIEAPVRTAFDQWLVDHARGTLNDELTFALAEVVEAVTHLKEKGTLTLVLTVEPAGSGARTVSVKGKVATKPPTPAPELSIFYVGENGSLHRDDPFVPHLAGVPFVDSAGEVKVVDPDTGAPRRVETPNDTPKRIED